MNSEQNKGYLMVLTAGALWGTIGFFATLLSNLGLGAAPVAFFRLLSASIMLALILLVKGKGIRLFKISRRGLISCMLVGFVSQACYNVCYMNAIEQGGMAMAAVFLYTSPIYVALISRILFFLIRPYNGIGAEFSLQMLLVLIGFGIVPSAMGYIVYYAGIGKVIETSRIPVLASVETVVAAVVGLVVFGQGLSLMKVIGIALVLCSIAVMNMTKKTE